MSSSLIEALVPLVVTRRLAAGDHEIVLENSDVLVVCFDLGGPARLEHERSGRVHRAVVSRGSFHVTAPRDRSIWRAKAASTHAHVVLPWSAVVRLSEAPHDAARHRFNARDAAVEHILHALLATANEGEGDPLLQEALFGALVRRLSGAPQAASRGPRLSSSALQRVVDFALARATDKVYVAELAAVAGVSEAHFAVAFRQATGIPPHQFLVRARVERARELLKDSKISVAAVATEVGFADGSHLTRKMRAVLGVTPSEIRRALV